jgi:hypothetical protein
MVWKRPEEEGKGLKTFFPKPAVFINQFHHAVNQPEEPKQSPSIHPSIHAFSSFFSLFVLSFCLRPQSYTAPPP